MGGGLIGAMADLQPDEQLAKILELRRAATTYENHPENDAARAEEKVSEQHRMRKGFRAKRFDFGIGLARCAECKSLPRCNRGCASCKQRICRKCFSSHECAGLVCAELTPDELTRSTPGVLI